MVNANLKPLHIFVDESGDFNFSPNGTRYYTITAIATFCPKEKEIELAQLRQNILTGKLCQGLDNLYLKKKLSRMFHATEDKQAVRNLVYETIQKLCYLKAYSIIIQKNKLNPVLYEPALFYPQFMGYLLDYVFKSYVFSTVSIIVSGTPVTKRQEVFKKTVLQQIKSKQLSQQYNISYTPANSIGMLQVVDYINWAIYRKWEKQDMRSYNLIREQMGKEELNIFESGDTHYYDY